MSADPDFPANDGDGRPAVDALLTGQQQAVATLLCEGLSNPHIAHRLYLTEHTVKSHVAAIYKALELHTRPQIAVRALELGLADPAWLAKQTRVCRGRWKPDRHAVPAAWLMRGLRIEDIAREMGVKPISLRPIVREAYAVCGCRTALEAVVKWVMHGHVPAAAVDEGPAALAEFIPTPPVLPTAGGFQPLLRPERPAPPVGVWVPTEGERRALAALATGRTGQAEPTVVAACLSKAGQPSRAALAALAVRHGFVKPELVLATRLELRLPEADLAAALLTQLAGGTLAPTIAPEEIAAACRGIGARTASHAAALWAIQCSTTA